MKNNVMPPLVLSIICIVVCGLLVLAYNATYVDTTGVMTDALQAGCEEIAGNGDYEILLKDRNAETKEPVNFGEETINAIIVDKQNQTTIFEITADGYAKGGLHILVGVDTEGAITGISFISISETPGLGTNVQNPSFLDKFVEMNADTDINTIDNVTGATYSSKGMKSACKTAVDTYKNHKEEILGD